MTTTPQGTIWVGKGEGAMTIEIATEIHKVEPSAKTERAFERLVEIDPNCQAIRTNLRLTGSPLTPYDLERISQCE